MVSPHDNRILNTLHPCELGGVEVTGTVSLITVEAVTVNIKTTLIIPFHISTIKTFKVSVQQSDKQRHLL